MLNSTKPLWVGIIILALSVLIWDSARNLEYEYAILLSWLAVLILPLLAYVPQNRQDELRFSWPRFFLLALLPVLAFVPGWLMFRFDLCPCVEMGFVFWMAILVVPSCWLGTAGYLWIRRLRPSGRKHFVVPSLMLIAVVISVAFLWFFPQKRAVSVVLGFVHGPIYDRLIRVDSGVVFGRMSHGILGLTMMLVAMGGIRFRSRACLFLLSTVAALNVACWRSVSGGHGFGPIQRELSKIVKADGVVLHYVPGSTEDDDMAISLARDAEFDVMEIKEWMDVHVQSPIHIFAYKNADQKKLLFGAGDTDVTDVFTPSVHIELSRSPHPTLRHELVHAVASYASWYGLGFHPNMMVTEGLAVALAPMDQELDLDQVAAGVLRSGRLASVTDLLSPIGFWSESGARSYILAGSLIRWLQKSFGAKIVNEIYRGHDVERELGRPLSAILDGWKKHIATIYNAKDDLIVERIDREPGVLHDTCPHSLDDLARSRAEGVFVRLRQPLGWDPDGFLTWALRVAPTSRQFQLKKFNNELKLRFEHGTMDPGALDAMIDVAQSGRQWPPRIIEDIEMAIIQSDLESIAGRPENSLKHLNDLQDVFSIKNPGAILRRQVEVRLAIDHELTGRDRSTWRSYLAGWGPMPGRQPTSSWIVDYLVAKRSRYPGKQDLDNWHKSLGSSSMYPEIQREWMKMSAYGYAEVGEFQAAGQLFGELAKYTHGEASLLAKQNVRRMAFLQGKTAK